MNLTEPQKTNLKLIVSECINRRVTNKYTVAAILAVIFKESGLIPKNENLNYTAARLREVFPSRFKTLAQAKEYEKQPEKIANYVYGGRFGNVEPGDGYKYRGRGHNQITFRAQYKSVGKAIGVDIETNPDLLNRPDVAAKAALSFFIGGSKVVLKGKDLNAAKSLTEALNDVYDINAGKIGKHKTDVTGGYKKAAENIDFFFAVLDNLNLSELQAQSEQVAKGFTLADFKWPEKYMYPGMILLGYGTSGSNVLEYIAQLAGLMCMAISTIGAIKTR